MQKACPWQAAMIWLMKLWRRMQNAEARWLAWCLGRYDFNYALSWQQIGLNWPSGHASSFPDSIHSFPDTWIYIIMLTLSNYCKVYKFTVWQQLINAQCQTFSRLCFNYSAFHVASQWCHEVTDWEALGYQVELPQSSHYQVSQPCFVMSWLACWLQDWIPIRIHFGVQAGLKSGLLEASRGGILWPQSGTTNWGLSSVGFQAGAMLGRLGQTGARNVDLCCTGHDNKTLRPAKHLCRCGKPQPKHIIFCIWLWTWKTREKHIWHLQASGLTCKRWHRHSSLQRPFWE